MIHVRRFDAFLHRGLDRLVDRRPAQVVGMTLYVVFFAIAAVFVVLFLLGGGFTWGAGAVP